MTTRDGQSRITSFFSTSTDRSGRRSSSIFTRGSSPSSSYSDFGLSPANHGSKFSRTSSADPDFDDRIEDMKKNSTKPIILGICAMDVKARSKAMTEILTRIRQRSRGAIEVKVFGDKVILDEDVDNWPRCNVLISFFSTDFPLDKAISYVKLRNPVCINELAPQALLWDRRLVGAMLDHLKVPTPRRLEVSRDGGPKIDRELRDLMKARLGVVLGRIQVTPEVSLREDGNAIIVDGKIMEKPFVEKPVSGEDHNVYIYFHGGGGRRLFRKVGNKSSELDPTLNHPRTDGSYIYEDFVDVDNSEDIKVYTVGKEYMHAETRKSPVVDGVVRRNIEGKEIRFITRLTPEERTWAGKICEAFGQRVCGFDMLRCDRGQKSQVIDVNGWSFVKGNDSYYDRAAEILAGFCMRPSIEPGRPLSSSPTNAEPQEEAPTWLLKANVTVFRHADRTPKQKLKFNFPVDEPWTQPFIRLLNGATEEIILREKDQLRSVAKAIEEAEALLGSQSDPTKPAIEGEAADTDSSTSDTKNDPPRDELIKLSQLNTTLFSKIDLPGTKAQLKPVYARRQKSNPKILADPSFPIPLSSSNSVTTRPERRLTKLTLVFKWGGEFTHSARYQSRDLGENMKKDILIMNKDILNNVKVYTSSERRVIASAEIFAAALLNPYQPGYSLPTPAPSSYPSSISIHSASSDGAMSANHQNGSVPHGSPRSMSAMHVDTVGTQEAATQSTVNVTNTESPVTLYIRKDLLDDSNAAKDLMDDVKKRLKILLRPGESEKRPELTWPKSMKKEPVEVVKEVIELLSSFRTIMHKNYETLDVDKIQDRWCCGDEPWLFRERWEKLFEDFCDVEQKKFDPSRVSELYDTIKYCALHHRQFLFAIFDERGGQRADSDGTDGPQDRRLHELYGRAKALFDLVAPQEYGIDPDEKEEIGVLTSLPLLRKVVEDLENARNNYGSSLRLYFTKESHIHTLVNLVVFSGLPIANRRIPELDYASHITFELYERNHGRGKSDKEYSIRISLSEGAHSSNVLDSTLDARHSLNVQPKKKLTVHLPYSLVIEKLSKHFNRIDEDDTETAIETIQTRPHVASSPADR